MRLISHFQHAQRVLLLAVRGCWKKASGSFSGGGVQLPKMYLTPFFEHHYFDKFGKRCLSIELFGRRPMESRTLFRLSVAFLASAFACSVHALQDGAYDPNFGAIGRTWIDAGPGSNDYVTTSLIRLPGGNLFMAGSCGFDPCAVWLTPSGAPLAGFGAAGTGTGSLAAYLGWPPNATIPSDAAAFADGRVVLITAKDLILLRADGTGLDPSVGNGAGYVGPVSAPLSALERVLVTPQQQVIVAGSTAASPRQFIVARYDSTFHLDTSFGTSGSTAIGFADGDAVPNQMTLQRDGKIVVIGTIGDSKALAIIRLTGRRRSRPGLRRQFRRALREHVRERRRRRHRHRRGQERPARDFGIRTNR